MEREYLVYFENKPTILIWGTFAGILNAYSDAIKIEEK